MTMTKEERKARLKELKKPKGPGPEVLGHHLRHRLASVPAFPFGLCHQSFSGRKVSLVVMSCGPISYVRHIRFLSCVGGDE
jgi:hypothetical protein